MGHRILLPLAFAISALVTNAQSMGEIRGKVLDEESKPIPFATVSIALPNGTISTTTDEQGRYVLKPLPTGTYSVTASANTFTSNSPEPVSVISDQHTKLNFTLVLAAKELVVFKKKVKADYVNRRPLIDESDPGRQTLLASEMKNDPNVKNPVKFMTTNFTGITASRDNEGLHFKGSRTENMASFVDGVRIGGRLPRVPSSAISSVTVYTGGLPAKYGDVTGGVVVIETKTYQELWAQERAMQLRREYDARQAQEALEQQLLEEKKPEEVKEETKDAEPEKKPKQGQEQPPLEQPKQ